MFMVWKVMIMYCVVENMVLEVDGWVMLWMLFDGSEVRG